MAMQKDSLFHRNWRKRPPEIDRGEGIYLYDVAGKKYLDGSGGPMVVNIGHGVKEITDAMVSQAERVTSRAALRSKSVMISDKVSGSSSARNKADCIASAQSKPPWQAKCRY